MKKKLVAMALSTAMILTGALGLTAQADDLGDPVTLTVTLTAVSTDYLTYGTENTYILSRTFSKRRPRLFSGEASVEKRSPLVIFSISFRTDSENFLRRSRSMTSTLILSQSGRTIRQRPKAFASLPSRVAKTLRALLSASLKDWNADSRH